jgi:GTP pyrophosphokinase
VPPTAWEAAVATGKARAAIRRATREAVRHQYAGLGRQIVERAFERAGRPYSDERLKAALMRLARHSIEDVLAAVGRGEIYSGDVVKAVHPDFVEERKTPQAPMGPGEPGWFGVKANANVVFKAPGAAGDADAGAIPIRGLRGDAPVRFAPEGGAVPGDRIVGIFTPGEGITIYPIQSPSLTAFDDQPERWLDVRWDIDPERPVFFPARIVVTAINEPGSLGALATIVGDTAANIDNISFKAHSPDFRDMTFDLEVADLKHLTDVLTRLRSSPLVSKVERVIG